VAEYANLEQHPIGKEYPAMDDDEFAGLVDDIRRNGIHTRMWLFENKVLDGWHRYQAMKEIGGALSSSNFNVFKGTEAEARALSDSLNGHRRHLTVADKTKKAERLLVSEPGLSDRLIGKMTGLSHVTVGKLRAKVTTSQEDRDFEEFKKRWRKLKTHYRSAFIDEFLVDVRTCLAVVKQKREVVTLTTE
jgi:ParB-like chromosome segregation protein Spo0J